MYKPNSLQCRRGFLSPYLCLSLGFAVPDWAHFLVLLDGYWLYCMELGGPDSGRKAGVVESHSGFGHPSQPGEKLWEGLWEGFVLRGFCRTFSSYLPFPLYFLCPWRVCLQPVATLDLCRIWEECWQVQLCPLVLESRWVVSAQSLQWVGFSSLGLWTFPRV